MGAEIQCFIRLWLLAITSILYCYLIASRIPSGITRLLSLLPAVFLFVALPLNLSSFLLAAPTIFYLVWLANFKLLLFSFDRGPLLARPPLSLLHFVSISLLPIKPAAGDDPSPAATKNPNFKFSKAALFAIKLPLLVKVIQTSNQRENLHQIVILALNCLQLYLAVELVLAITAVPVRFLLGLEIEPQFNEPYLATSLQDFWGRRWNLMVTSILRPAVYDPIRSVCSPVLGGDGGRAAAILATFSVSGLMHEVIYYYLSRARPTWEVTWFFVLHGVCVAAEIPVKKAVSRRGRWRLHRAVSGPLTIGFVGVTGAWLFFPQVVRNGLDLKAINECCVLIRFVKEKIAQHLI